MAAASLRALVTGASSGIGLATARHLAQAGAHVCLTGRNEQALQALVAELGEHTSYVAGDLTHDGACERIVDGAVGRLGSLTTLVNCAGVLQGGAFGTDACNLDNFQYNFNGNTRSVFEMMQHTIPHLREAARGGSEDASPCRRDISITNISSVNGKQAFAMTATYCASKV